MPSPLSFDSTENFRKKLLVKNLQPYNSDGFVPNSEPGTTEFNLNDQAVVDSVEVEVIGEDESKNAYVKNLYGPEGGYGMPLSVDDVINPSSTALIGKEGYFTFISSTYNAFSLLTSNNPQGDNGSLSQDSNLAKIAADSLKSEFEYRVAQETYQQTLGRVNAIDALQDPYDLLGIVTGNKTIIERDWKISVPKNIFAKGLDFISRISGVYSPYSWIPGDYFSTEPRQLLLNQAANAVTGLFDKRGILKLPTEKTGMQTFLDNTGGGQRSRLFKGLSMNRYVPDYNKNFLTDLFTEVPKQNYYVGSSQQEVSDIVAPQDSLPLDQDGNKTQSPVFGYDEVAKIYENEQKENQFKFGLNQTSTYDGGGVQGGFTWVSPKRKDSAGQKVGRGAEFYGTIDGDWTETGIQTTFQANQSVGGAGDYEFTKGSILDNTQQLINSADEVTGVKRLQHVGNAIDQVSKVFHDGTRELTKGSRVIAYKDEGGAIVGKEYCRVFTKDTPYYSMADLQKGDGITESGRKFTYSVLDRTYNLNIAPIRGDESTNLTGNDFSKDGVKKYMFSLENLAWRTSRKKGFTYQDLPHCERGPNGGRIMWFPPYDMSVSETNSANWNSNEFLGRPEPVYTYNNTSRVGSLSWKIIVDHPSILNAIVDKELKDESNSRVNAIVDSFFAGCRKYDIYELALRFPQFTYQDIYDIITTYPEPEVVKAEFKKEVTPIPGDKDPAVEEEPKKVTPQDYEFAYYFHNDVPGPRNKTSTTADEDYLKSLNKYLSLESDYKKKASNKNDVMKFFDDNVKTTKDNINSLVKKIGTALNAGAEIEISMKGSASSPNTKEYNVALSKRRINSVKQYLLKLKDENENTLQDWVDKGKLVINDNPVGEQTEIEDTDCSKELTGNDKIYSTDAMKCRRVKISKITEKYPDPDPVTDEEEDIIQDDIITSTGTTQPVPPPAKDPTSFIRQKEEVAKIIVRKLLTECDYFDVMKETTPLVYDGIKEKIKYFQPAFHSITPEGLNSRLTFLQQCIRPGDTIPVIGEDGKPTEFNAKNTAFGAPPICVLRIGDFYHSKIAINQIGIQYEPLTFDLNPEGIGVQPMLASINMSFYFIGGQGLKEPVARLQNALSFNYYANTEVYDDRSVVTEEREELNREIWQEIESTTEFGINNRTTQEDIPGIGNTIGVERAEQQFVSYPSNGADTVSGSTSFKTIMDETPAMVKAYADNIINTLTEISNQYSYDGMAYFNADRNYLEGDMLGYYGSPTYFTGLTQTIGLFGKPQENVIQERVDKLFTDTINDISGGTSPLLKNINTSNFAKKDITKYKANIVNKINQIKQTYINGYMSVMSDMSSNQTNLVWNIDRLNFVLTNTDGYQLNNGKNILLDLTATTEVDISSTNPVPDNTYEEMYDDIFTMGLDLAYLDNQLFINADKYFQKEYNANYGFSILDEPYKSDPAFVRLMHVCYKEIGDKPTEFVDAILGQDLKAKPEWVKYVNKIVFGVAGTPAITEELVMGTEGYGSNVILPEVPAVKGLTDIYQNMSIKSNNRLSELKKKPDVTKFAEYTPFTLGKERVFNYVKVPVSENNPDKVGFFTNLYKLMNIGDKKTFNGKIDI
jgi:outer membrane protein OmpA-like peptidoglycan-associated protein